MKTSKTFVRLFTTALALIGAVLTTPLPAAAASGAIAGKAVVVKVDGAASYVGAKGADGAVRVGMTLHQGTSIITGTESSVILDLGENGETVVVRPNTTLSLDTLQLLPTGIEKIATTRIDLKRGSMAFSVKKLAAASKYEVKTANGVAGIRGSEGIIYATGVFVCLDGTLLVSVTNLTTGVVELFTVTRGNTGTASGSNIVLTPIPPADFNRMKADIGTATLAVQEVRPPAGRPPPSASEVAAQVVKPFISPVTPALP